MKNKTVIGIAVILVIMIGVAVILKFDNGLGTVKSGKIKVVVTLFPLYDMAKNIGGDKAEVSLLLPPGTEAHSFELKPSDLVKINEADVFIYTNKFMEPWAEDVIKGISNKNLLVVDVSQGLNIITGDPHIWLDLDNIKTMLGNILQAFSTKNNSAAAFYEQRAGQYLNKLNQLDYDYETTFVKCKNKEIIYGGHDTFSYLADRYGLEYLAAQGVLLDSEPAAGDLADLVDRIKKNSIKYIFYEKLDSPKIAQTLAEETDIKILPLNSAHNLTKEQFEQNVSLFDILNANLENLKIGLDCN